MKKTLKLPNCRQLSLVYSCFGPNTLILFDCPFKLIVFYNFVQAKKENKLGSSTDPDGNDLNGM